MNIDNAIIRYKDYGRGMRLIARQILLHKGNFINAIIGPRRAGKTFLMLLHKNAIELPDSNKIFISGEDIDFEGIRTDDLDEIERAIFRIYNPDMSKDIYMFIDEIQNFPSWGRWLRTLFDENRYHIIISGSTSELSTDNLPNELRGRAINVLVLPFSFAEYCSSKGVDYSKYMNSASAGELLRSFEEFINFGGYPLVTASDTVGSKNIVLRELYETVLQKDIIDKYAIRKSSTLKAFTNSLLGSACRPVSPAKLASWFSSNGMPMSPQTALNYMTYAQNVFLFFLVSPYSRKPKERNARSKLYLADSGLLSIVSSDFSKKLENQVFIEMLRRGMRVSYYAKRNCEVDFVVEDKSVVKELIQVCYSINDSETYARETTALAKASDDLKCKRLKILTFNEQKKIETGGKTIDVIPAWKWMLE
jgi:predicted AAA+ superfamily ATPase